MKSTIAMEMLMSTIDSNPWDIMRTLDSRMWHESESNIDDEDTAIITAYVEEFFATQPNFGGCDVERYLNNLPLINGNPKAEHEPMPKVSWLDFF